MGNTGTSSLTINELREFAGFSPCEQRYIRRSLDIGLVRQDAFKLWARDAGEVSSIRSQYVGYQGRKALRCDRPHGPELGHRHPTWAVGEPEDPCIRRALADGSSHDRTTLIARG